MTDKKGSTDRFGIEWDKYNQIVPEYEIQFKKWIYPLAAKDFKGKIVLDAGCGAGRNSYWALKCGADMVYALDYDFNTVQVASANLRDKLKFKNCIPCYGSIYDVHKDYKNYFDISMSIGVIHHLEKPEAAIDSMIEATKKGGKVLIWVYGYEGNEWIVRYISPIRKITSMLPAKLIDLISYFISIPMFAYLKLFKQKSPYLEQLSKFKFWHVHSIIFDQLIPKIANYWTMSEAFNLLKGKLKNVQINHINENSWTVIGTKGTSK